jgi:hypothetical protein
MSYLTHLIDLNISPQVLVSQSLSTHLLLSEPCYDTTIGPSEGVLLGWINTLKIKQRHKFFFKKL